LPDLGVEGALPLFLDEHWEIELFDVDLGAGLAQLFL